jgi:hypothetical protein
MSAGPHYQRTYRRTLLDMHIPDWDPAFLSQYEPERLADMYAAAGVAGVLQYCKSHMGLNYWPSPIGGIHPAAANRDLVGELHRCLVDRGIAPAAYHTVVFDNWAVANHPEWAVRPVGAPDAVAAGFTRYGVACVNNPAYRAYETGQLEALVGRYDFDALWIDMVFMPAHCVCDWCRQRYRDETGADMPDRIDWSSSSWITFHEARERWVEDFYTTVIGAVRSVRPELAVTHNLSPSWHGLSGGATAEQARFDTYTSGDFYGGQDEMLLVTTLMRSLTQEQPGEFMTSRALELGSHTSLKSEHELLVQNLGALAQGSAFLFIDAIDPAGTVNEGVYRRIGRVFAETAPYEPFVGGVPIDDVAIYYSSEAFVDTGDNGRSTTELGASAAPPSRLAVVGAVRALRRAHVPFGVITQKNLSDLARYRVIVLGDLVRMSSEEISAFRSYVESGGRLYASGRTSLLNTDGSSHGDFELADVFGCHVDSLEDGAGIYIAAASDLVRRPLQPERFLGHGFPSVFETMSGAPPRPVGLPRLALGADGDVLATLNLPYGYPSPGSMRGRDFASIHSSPPWSDLENPTIVSHSFGGGRCIFSVAPLEAVDDAVHMALFAALVYELLDHQPTLVATTDPNVWISAFDHVDDCRLTIAALRYETEPPTGVVPVSLRLRPLPDRRVIGVRHVLSGLNQPYSEHLDGTVDIFLHDLRLFDMYFVDYKTAVPDSE